MMQIIMPFNPMGSITPGVLRDILM